jgi:uncharacterized membrane protein YccF (DUF307 family)
MRTIGNVIWLVCGGFWMAIGWWVAGLLMALSIVGLPWARSCFVLGHLCIWPFGREAIDRKDLTGRDDLGTGTLGTVGNVVWFVFAGIWLTLAHLAQAIALCLTIIGIPWGLQHIKMALCALAPVGKTVVESDAADRAYARHRKIGLLGM